MLCQFKIDDFPKSLKTPFFVIPAKAGIQFFQRLINPLASRHCEELIDEAIS
jgi:hypothetical protein